MAKIVKWKDWSFWPTWYRTPGLVDILKIIETPYFGVAINDIKAEDPSELYHDHPWWFFSFTFKGNYSERIWEDWRDFDKSFVKHRPRFSFHRIKPGQAHQIFECEPHTYTLFIHGRWLRDGFRFYMEGDTIDMSWIPIVEPGSNMVPIRGKDHIEKT